MTSQVQKLQMIEPSPSVHSDAASTSILNTPPINSNDMKQHRQKYNTFPHAFHEHSSPSSSATMLDMDPHGRMYGAPVAYPSPYQPFYISILGGTPVQMAALSNPGPDMYQGRMPQNIPLTQNPHSQLRSMPELTYNHDNYARPIEIPTPRKNMKQSVSVSPDSHNMSKPSNLNTSSESYPYRHKDPRLSKRTKVSRACDECRRKKTRCDIDAEHEICTPCVRAGVPCTFARAQLKRGPAKKRLSQDSLPLPVFYSSSYQTNGDAQYMKCNGTVPRKSRSASDSFNVGLPPIETLLNYNSNGVPPNKPMAPTPVHAPSPIKNSTGFPMLVEVACRQSESPTEHHSPLDKSIQSTPNVPQTPPTKYDKEILGISHNALMEYYSYTHPVFPLLPDKISDVSAMLNAAGSSRDCLYSSLNGTANHEHFSLRNPTSCDTSTARECHLIALLFTYLRSFDMSWLGASIAACTSMVSSLQGKDSLSETSIRLTALVTILDRIHCAVFGTPSLLPECLVCIAKSCKSLAPTLHLLGLNVSITGNDGIHTPQQSVIALFGKLLQENLTLTEAKSKLQYLIPQLRRTPLEQFASALIARH